MSKHIYHKKINNTKKQDTKKHDTKKHDTKKQGRKGCRGRKTLKQMGGGFMYQLIPSDIKQIGYFFENGAKLFYKSILGMP